MLPIMLATGLGCAIGGIALPGTAFAQQPWSPHRPVELVVPTAPGSSMDLLARVIQDIWQKSRRVSQPVIVQVKSGGGGSLAWTYVSRKTGDGHVLAISGPTLLSQEVMQTGELSWRDMTPIAQLFTEYTGFAVRADGPIRTGADLVAAMRSGTPPSIGVAPGYGGSNHVAALKLARVAGVKAAELPIVLFKGSNESVAALLGGHIVVSIATMAVLAPMLETGQLRMIAVAAPQRLADPLSSVPTWRELGFDVVEGNWRGVVGPKDLGEAEIAYWSGQLAEAVKSDEWAVNLKRNFWDADFRGSADAKLFLRAQLEELRSSLVQVAPPK